MMMKQMQVVQFLQRSRSAVLQHVTVGTLRTRTPLRTSSSPTYSTSLRGFSILSSSSLSSNRPPSDTASRQYHVRNHYVFHHSNHNSRWFASAAANADIIKDLPVKILYGSQGGTAQIFAMQLSEALEEVPGHKDRDITVQGLHEEAPADILKPGEAFYIVLAATAGVGEPTDNARQFHDYLTSGSAQNLDGVHYCVFGLGNQKAHPNHYNVMGKLLDKRLEELGASRVYDLGLGDDGECIEDDYDVWMEGLLQSVYYGKGGEDQKQEENVSPTDTSADAPAATAVQVEDPNVTLEACEGAKGGTRKRLVSSKFGRLQLTPNDTDTIRDNMFHLSSDKSFYMEGTQSLPVMSNRPLCASPGENGMYEMRVTLENSPTKMTYETGDHLMVYPQNSQAMVEGFLQRFDVDPHAIIHAPDESNARKHPYPHPTGITLSETLKHCVDLSAVPPPNVARLLLGRQQIDYKNEIANPRRTVLDLVSEASRPFALEEILYNLPPMKARYYSIASSSLVHPNEVYLVYRPVSYTSTRGELRLGVSTSYMKNMMGVEDDRLDDYNRSESGLASSLIGVVNSNPSFRLPRDPKIPVLFIAGGCGIAPIRAFLEERIYGAMESRTPYGEGYLFLGFRSPGDAPYKNLIQSAFQCGAINNVHLTYTSGCGKGANASLFGDNDIRAHTSCGLVSDAVGEHGEQLYSFFERGGYTFICGGARMFGVAIENEVHSILKGQGNLSDDEATDYLRRLLDEGRFMEDLSD